MQDALSIFRTAPVAFGGSAFVLSLIAVGLIRRVLHRQRVLDVPNERSSHKVPVARGGGLAVVIIQLGLAYALFEHHWRVEPDLAAALIAVAAIALIGWLDDRYSLSTSARILVHVAAGIAVAWSAASVPSAVGLPTILWLLWWIFWTVAAVNVVNFVDGIDGLIAASMTVYGAYIFARAPHGSTAAAYGLSLGCATLGFLAWNWAPAKIFLGDVGSGTLGIMAVFGGLLLMRASTLGFAATFLPLYPIFLDASVTLIRRASRGEPLTKPHRSHLYQRLANSGWGHAPVSGLFAALSALGAGLLLMLPTTPWIVIAPYTLGVGALYWGLDKHVSRRATTRAHRPVAAPRS